MQKLHLLCLMLLILYLFWQVESLWRGSSLSHRCVSAFIIVRPAVSRTFSTVHTNWAIGVCVPTCLCCLALLARKWNKIAFCILAAVWWLPLVTHMCQFTHQLLKGIKSDGIRCRCQYGHSWIPILDVQIRPPAPSGISSSQGPWWYNI